ncbi:ribonuclease 3-like protein 3 [Heracleum sosnowskyi]|uniref:Ribonuclease 3-like protein 3 n=1 Tax=Heracleum sosnowskyi TaxID=360622 RepID=A0AAD8JMS5_9APIA|nr:ribonuclease 3-like protein 3 [Heracleum sosnowskyi]
MASSPSWLQSFVSPSLIALSKRLRAHGLPLINVLNDIITKDKLRSPVQVGDDDTSCSSESLPSLEEVEKIIGYNFKNQSLLQQAFTHQSYQQKCESYERLEFVGDSVLNLLITQQQFYMYPDLPPGMLSPLRSANVDTEKLARVAIKYDLLKYLRHNNRKLSQQVRGFLKALPKYPLHSYGLIDPPKVLADIVESTIGAVYIDSNSSMDITWEVVKDLLEPMITPEMIQENPVKKLQEMCQKQRLKVRFKDIWLKKGTFEVYIDDQLRGKGEYRAKKEIALNRAANDAYNDIAGSFCVNDETEK